MLPRAQNSNVREGESFSRPSRSYVQLAATRVPRALEAENVRPLRNSIPSGRLRGEEEVTQTRYEVTLRNRTSTGTKSASPLERVLPDLRSNNSCSASYSYHPPRFASCRRRHQQRAKEKSAAATFCDAPRIVRRIRYFRASCRSRRSILGFPRGKRANSRGQNSRSHVRIVSRDPLGAITSISNDRRRRRAAWLTSTVM